MLKRIGVVGVIAILIQLVYLPIYESSIVTDGIAGFEAVTLLSGKYIYTTIIRWSLSIIGIGIVIYGLFKKTALAQKYYLFSTALCLILAGEFMGRYLFYATGIPMTIG